MSQIINKSCDNVSDRLLAIGKLYEAKKQKMREDTAIKKKLEEEIIIQKAKKIEKSNSKSDLPVQ